jgi:hypothetical protein
MPRSAQSCRNPGDLGIADEYPRRRPAPRRRLTTIHRRLDNLRSASQSVPQEDPPAEQTWPTLRAAEAAVNRGSVDVNLLATWGVGEPVLP